MTKCVNGRTFCVSLQMATSSRFSMDSLTTGHQLSLCLQGGYLQRKFVEGVILKCLAISHLTSPTFVSSSFIYHLQEYSHTSPINACMHSCINTFKYSYTSYTFHISNPKFYLTVSFQFSSRTIIMSSVKF